MNFFKKKKPIETIDFKAPAHIAVIMDGNYRWSKSKNLPLKIGHKKGTENIEKIIDASIEFGTKYLTIYAFSSENWNRPKDEVEYLLALLDEYLDKEIKSLMAKGVRILISGNLTRLSQKTRDKIKEIEEATAKNEKFTLNVAFSYGARQEIVDAIKKIALEVTENPSRIDEIDEGLVAKNLYQPQVPDPDLMIRTAGDVRISNFLLWQSAYTEFYFTDILWPDFSKDDLKKAIIDFNQRIRKYGKR